jgi:hypothetical protein
MGFQRVEVHDVAQDLNNFFEMDSKRKAEIIIRSHDDHVSVADLGFKRGHDGRFEAIIDESDQLFYGQAWLQHLTQRYAYNVAVDTLKEQDFELVDESVESDQTIHLTLRRMT